MMLLRYYSPPKLDSFSFLNLFLLSLVLALSLSTVTAEAQVAGKKQSLDDAVRLEYNEANSQLLPDATAFKLWARAMSGIAKNHGAEAVVSVVHTSLNLVPDGQRGMTAPPAGEERHSIEVSRKLTKYALKAHKGFKAQDKEKAKSLLCNEPLYGDQISERMDLLDDAMEVGAQAEYLKVFRKFDPDVLSDLSRWLGEIKPGIRITKYDHKKLYKKLGAVPEHKRNEICSSMDNPKA